MGEIITKTNKEVLQFFDEMKRISTFIDALKSGYTPSLNGERFLTDTELSEMLKLTKRTLLGISELRENPLLSNRRENTLQGK